MAKDIEKKIVDAVESVGDALVGGVEAAGLGVKRNRSTEAKDPAQYGQVFLSWQCDSKPHYERGKWWYIGMGIAGVFLLLYAVISANFLFALIILMFALILYLSIIVGPERRQCTLTEEGFIYGKAFYPYRQLSRFWFAYDPPMVKKMYIETKSRFSPPLTISLERQNPNSIREVLGQFVPEDLDRAEEPLTDVISRILKIS